jgi:hypothetical protein
MLGLGMARGMRGPRHGLGTTLVSHWLAAMLASAPLVVGPHHLWVNMLRRRCTRSWNSTPRPEPLVVWRAHGVHRHGLRSAIPMVLQQL